ncbi:MAG TPA: alkaline phosphatase family protein [Candidatus Bathyarchaeia archaeon]|nr:alkaline phosphatase family protein [Candidatus Bathyarchaeia archaeon]
MSNVVSSKPEHVVIIVKENHTFDNYFGTFPGANGLKMPVSQNPPLHDPDHRHSAWLTRETTSVREQFVESNIPGYFAYARKFTLCDQYFTEVAGPSTPNHLMLIAADSPFIDNPPRGGTPPRSISASLPLSLERSRLSWGNYGGYAFEYLSGVSSRRKFTSDQFAKDASTGKLPSVSWVYAPSEFDEHPPYGKMSGVMGNVTKGMQWTVDQVNAIVKGGLWPRTSIFITWDDWGGWYDHVQPPNVETWTLAAPQVSYKNTEFRYGSRVGCLVIGPYARPGYISKKLHSHVSLLRFCESIFGLAALNKRDGGADDMMDCFDYNQKPLQPPPSKP